MTDSDRSWDVHLLMQDYVRPEQIKHRNRPMISGVWKGVLVALAIEAVAVAAVWAAIWGMR